jgi:pyruvate-formate lyase-activating enzyme
MATRELNQVIKDLLPKIQILLHPSHPDYAKEYPTATHIAEEALEDSPRRPGQQRQ